MANKMIGGQPLDFPSRMVFNSAGYIKMVHHSDHDGESRSGADVPTRAPRALPNGSRTTVDGGDAKPEVLVRQYVSTAVRNSNGQNRTRLAFAGSVAAVCFLLSLQLPGADVWQAAFNASVLALVAIAISVAFPILLSMFRWLLLLGVLLTLGYLAFSMRMS